MRPHSTRTVPGPGALCRRGRGSGALSSLQKRLSGSAKYNVIRRGLYCSPAWGNPKAETGLRRLSAPTHGSPATLQRRPSGARRPATETRRTRTSCRAGQSRKGGKASLWRPAGAAAVARAPPQNRRESPHPHETLPPDLALQGHHDDFPLTPVLRVDLVFCRTLGPSAPAARKTSRHSRGVPAVAPNFGSWTPDWRHEAALERGPLCARPSERPFPPRPVSVPVQVALEAHSAGPETETCTLDPFRAAGEGRRARTSHGRACHGAKPRGAPPGSTGGAPHPERITTAVWRRSASTAANRRRTPARRRGCRAAC